MGTAIVLNKGVVTVKLMHVQVTNFRCVEDSTRFSLAQTTCLVGKNESGKTSILQALRKLRAYDDKKAKYDKLRDYPRKHLADYKERHPDSEAVAVHTEWLLGDPDVALLEAKFGAGCLKSRTVHVSKRYETETGEWSIDLDESVLVKHLTNGCPTGEKAAFRKAKDAEELLSLASAQAEPSEVAKAIVTTISGYRDKSPTLGAIDILSPRMPTFLYFSQYERMNGEVSLEKLTLDLNNKQLQPGDNVFLQFLEFANTSLKDLSNVSKFEELRAKIEAASIKITRQIFEYWSQNQHLKVDFTIDAGRPGDPVPFNTGYVMRARIRNLLHDMTVSFDDRSAGFVWFFSFLVLFSQVKKTHGNIIILLDEPGLNLHAKAQADLLRYIKEKLEPHHQVIYTTHSPFMIPANDLLSVRTVEDVVLYKGPGRYEVFGTKIGDDVLSTDRDTLFPLQSALGYEITQSLFIGEHSLLVEGPGDILYMTAVSQELAVRSRTALDKRWTMCPTGGIDKVSAFVSLFGGNKLHVAVFTDMAAGQKTKLEQLRKSKLLKDGHVLSAADYCGQAEADIEDLLGPDLYCGFVNKAFGLSGAIEVTPAKCGAIVTPAPRILKRVEDVFKVMPPGSPEFDHFSPAAWLIRNQDALAGNEPSTAAMLDRFERLFKDLNALLP